MPNNDDVEIPSMMLDQDEVKERRAQLDSGKKRSPSTPSDSKILDEKVANNVEQEKKPKLIWVYVLLIAAFAVLAVLAYMGWSQNQMLKSELQGQIQNLDSQLVAVDASASEQGSSIKEVLKNHDSEIRKLWGVSYDTNRKAIKSNKDSVDALEKVQAGLKSDLSDAVAKQTANYNALSDKQKTLIDSLDTLTKKTLVALQEQQESMRKSLVALEGDSTLLTSKVESQRSQIDSLLKTVAALEKSNVESSAKLKEADKTLKDVTSRLASLENKIKQQLGDVSPGDMLIQLKDHQEAIDSIDAYRVQVNNKLNRLEANVNELLLQSQVK